jgi:hypothetical protein
MKITQVAGWTLVGVLAGCGGGTEAKKDEAKPEAKKDEAKPEDKKPAEAKPEVKPEDKKPDEAKPADAPAAGGEWGVAACDNYMKTVSDCKTFKMDSPVFKGITDKWKKLKDEGKTEDLEKGCSKAAELFKCPAK